MQLKDKVILVTGATSGLGKQAALAYAAEGATVILLARKVKRLELIYDEIVQAGYPQPAAIPLDLGKVSDAEFDKVADLIDKEFGRLDGILHSASQLNSLTMVHNQSLEEWLEIMRVNLIGAARLTSACFPLLCASQDASVLFTSCTQGHQPKAYWGNFAVAKAGVEALVKVLADEWEHYSHLRVNTLIPGAVDSPQRAKTHPAENKDALPSMGTLMQTYVYWMSAASRGRSGEIILCQENAL